MNCTTLLAATQSHHLPYLEISQTQQPYFELSKDLNTIHSNTNLAWLSQISTEVRSLYWRYFHNCCNDRN